MTRKFSKSGARNNPYPAEYLAWVILPFLFLAIVFTWSDSGHARTLGDICNERAQRLSGYSAGSETVANALRGALAASVLSRLVGADEQSRRRASAAAGFLSGVRAADRPNSKAARIYRLEFEDCIRRK